MSLPSLNAPIFTTILPSTGKTIKFRPFLVKEEKILLIALQDAGKNEATLLAAINEIIDGCTFNALNISELTNFDLDHLFLQLHIKSKGDMKELKFKCNHIDEETGKECGCINSVLFDLNNAKIVTDPTHSKKIMITDEVGLIMKYPSFDTLQDLYALIEKNDVEALYTAFTSMISEVFKGDTVFDTFTVDEMREFVETFTYEQFDKVKHFFETMPKLIADIDITCAKCHAKETVHVEGLQNFLE